MIPLFRDPAVGQDEDDICILHRRKPVGHDDHGPVLPVLLKYGLDRLFRFGIQT
jgi:hypothetical protein